MIGDKKQIAFEIGPYLFDSLQQQIITIWVGGNQINPIDDNIYFPSFYIKLKNEICRLEANEFTRPDCDGLELDEIFNRLEHETTPLFQVLNDDLPTCAVVCYFLEYDLRNVLLFKYWDYRHRPAEGGSRKGTGPKVFGTRVAFVALSGSQLFYLLP